MKRIFTFLMLVAFTAAGAFAQFEKYFDFEEVEEGSSADEWIMFGNGANPDTLNDMKVVVNPLQDNMNPSDSVLQYVVNDDAVPWCGAYTDVLWDDLIIIEEGASVLGMMVYKDIISPTRLKIELSETGAEDIGVPVDNTVTGEWELLLYDFAEVNGNYFKRLTFFPDFPSERVSGTTLYIDNIGVPREDNTSVKEYAGVTMMIYPNPADFRTAVVYPGMYRITVSDILGKKIRTISFAPRDSKVIEVGDLKTGLYVITAETATGAYTLPFVKK